MVAIVTGQLGAGVVNGARIAFWLAAILLVYVYAGYPLILSLIGLFVRRSRAEAGYTPRISVLIAAYNEEEAIERKIQQTLALEYPQEKLELLVLSDCSSDRTDEIVSAFPDSRVRLVRLPDRGGKTLAQNYGVKQATGVFFDFTATT